MSEKNASLAKFSVALLFLLFSGLVSCDPCRQLAEQICDCRPAEADRRACYEQVKLAAVHKYKANADDAETCQELIKECFCSDILTGDEQKCGIYRK